MVFQRHRRPEDRLDFVADELEHQAMMGIDGLGHGLEVGVDDRDHLSRGDGFDQPCKIPEVGKQDGHLLEFPAQGYPAAENLVANHLRHIPSEGFVQKIPFPLLAALAVHHPAGKQGHEVEPGHLKSHNGYRYSAGVDVVVKKVGVNDAGGNTGE